MSRKKLTLSVQERLTKRAKQVAKKRGTSVSRLVETFFTALEENALEENSSEENAIEEEEARRGARQPVEGHLSESDDEPESDKEEFSEWARRWRGAFAEEGETYPDDPSWEEDRLREELEKKHAPQ
jgi:antitoxin component of RelBE/YafQ-DinJ toxin-antitoxin module